MTPTTTDDAALVRELAAHVDRAVPPMGLEPDTVLARGRRHRRRTRALHAVAGSAAAVAVGLGGAQLAGLDVLARVAGDPSVGPLETAVVGDLTVTSATSAVPLETDEGTVFDLRVAVDPADPGGARYVVEHVVLDPADVPDLDVTLLDEAGRPVDAEAGEVPTEWLQVRTYDPATGRLGELDEFALSAWPDPFVTGPPGALRKTHGTASGGEYAGTVVVLGIADEGYQPELYPVGVQARAYLPTFEIPGAPGPVFFARLTSDEPVGSWPKLRVYPAAYVGADIT